MSLDELPPPPISSHYEEPLYSSSREVIKPTLVLYGRKNCPFCKRVYNYLQQNGKIIEIQDIGENSVAAKELMRIGGKKQVPCLFINGRPLYESLDIIEWLEKNKDLY